MGTAWHTREAWEKRQAGREPPTALAVFWHVGCLNHWRDVVTEQLRLLAHVGLKRVRAGILGRPDEIDWCAKEAERRGIALEVVCAKASLAFWEGPTLEAVWQYAVAHPTEAILYMHSKGVTAPRCPIKRQWRRAMQKYTIGDWRRSLELLATHDMTGLCWQELADFPHYCGNFWMARCDWIANLSNPADYRRRRRDFSWAGHSWSRRMYCETWLGSEQWHTIDAFTRNGCLWEGNQVFTLPTEIEGFVYDDQVCVEIGGGVTPLGKPWVNVDRQSVSGVDVVADLERLGEGDGDGEGKNRLPFKDASVDRVYSAHCLEHVRNLHGVLNEIARIAKIGAEVEIRVPSPFSEMAMCWDHKQTIGEEQVHHWCQSAVKFWFKGARRLKHLRTEHVAGTRFAEAKALLPAWRDDQIMHFIPNACHEYRYFFEVCENV